MKVLVTGSHGQVGRAVLPILAGKGYELFHYDRAEGKDIHDEDTLRESLTGMDAVIHLAGIRGPEFLVPQKEGAPGGDKTEQDYIKDNFEGARKVLDIAHECGVKHFVFSSSNDIYGTSELSPDKIPWPITDDTKPLGTNIYAKCKLRFEEYMRAKAKKYDMVCVSLRIGGFLGGSREYPWHATIETVAESFHRALQRNTSGLEKHNIAERECPVKSLRTDRFMGRLG